MIACYTTRSDREHMLSRFNEDIRRICPHDGPVVTDREIRGASIQKEGLCICIAIFGHCVENVVL